MLVPLMNTKNRHKIAIYAYKKRNAGRNHNSLATMHISSSLSETWIIAMVTSEAEKTIVGKSMHHTMRQDLSH